MSCFESLSSLTNWVSMTAGVLGIFAIGLCVSMSPHARDMKSPPAGFAGFCWSVGEMGLGLFVRVGVGLYGKS